MWVMIVHETTWRSFGGYGCPVRIRRFFDDPWGPWMACVLPTPWMAMVQVLAWHTPPNSQTWVNLVPKKDYFPKCPIINWLIILPIIYIQAGSTVELAIFEVPLLHLQVEHQARCRLPCLDLMDGCRRACWEQCNIETFTAPRASMKWDQVPWFKVGLCVYIYIYTLDITR